MKCNMICPLDLIALWTLLDTMGCKMCCLVWRNITQQPKLVQYLLFQSFNGIMSICIYHEVCKAWYRISVYSCHYPFIASWGYQHGSNIIHLPAMCKAFPLGIFPIAICNLCLSAVSNRTVFVGTLCLRGCKKNMPRFSLSLHHCSLPHHVCSVYGSE